MYSILEEKIKPLDKKTFLFYGHEYAYDNFKYQTYIYPENEYLQDLYKEYGKNKEKGVPSLPGTLEEEYRSNLFFLSSDPDVQKKYLIIDYLLELTPRIRLSAYKN